MYEDGISSLQGPTQEIPPTILIVDDAPSTCNLVMAMCQMMGLKAFPAYDAESALSIAGRIAPDIILCDIHMHPVSGREFVQRARASSDAAISKAHIVMMSGDSDHDMLASLANAGIDGYIMKPLSQTKLRRLVSLDAVTGDEDDDLY